MVIRERCKPLISVGPSGDIASLNGGYVQWATSISTNSTTAAFWYYYPAAHDRK